MKRRETRHFHSGLIRRSLLQNTGLARARVSFAGKQIRLAEFLAKGAPRALGRIMSAVLIRARESRTIQRLSLSSQCTRVHHTDRCAWGARKSPPRVSDDIDIDARVDGRFFLLVKEWFENLMNCSLESKRISVGNIIWWEFWLVSIRLLLLIQMDWRQGDRSIIPFLDWKFNERENCRQQIPHRSVSFRNFSTVAKEKTQRPGEKEWKTRRVEQGYLSKTPSEKKDGFEKNKKGKKKNTPKSPRKSWKNSRYAG